MTKTCHEHSGLVASVNGLGQEIDEVKQLLKEYRERDYADKDALFKKIDHLTWKMFGLLITAMGAGGVLGGVL